MLRHRVPELMDDPAVDRQSLADALTYIRQVNRRLGGQSTLLNQLRFWSTSWKKGQTITLLDVATGSADLPVAACAWAAAAGFDLRVTATDSHATTLDLAREHVNAHGFADRITLAHMPAQRMMDSFSFGAFDYVHAGLFLHHLPEIEILTVLRIMDRLARCGVLWNDLVRSRPGLWFITLATLRASPMVKHDARASVRAGFTKREALDLAQRAGIEKPVYRWNLFTHRFAVSSSKPVTTPVV